MASDRRRPMGRPKGKGTEHVRNTLRDRIITTELEPDAILDEAVLVKEFQVSCTPVREALIQLAGEGYVLLQPNRSTRVTPLHVRGMVSCYEALELCARALVRWAAARRKEKHLQEMEIHNAACQAAVDDEKYARLSDANRKFHATIGRAAANEYFAKLYEELPMTSQRYANAIIYPDPFRKPWEHEQYQSVVREHAQMIEAIRAGDASTAEKRARMHIQRFRDRVIEHFREEISVEPMVLEYLRSP